MRLSVEVTGTQALARKMRSLGSAMAGEKLAQATLAGALIVEGRAKEKALVRTGTLRRSITSQLAESSRERAVVKIGTNVEYAPFLEWGTRYMAARPYLRPALDESKDEAQRVISAALRELIRDVV